MTIIQQTKKMTIMFRSKMYKSVGFAMLTFSLSACVPTLLSKKTENKTVPADYAYTNSQGTTNSGQLVWKQFFTDPYLIALIDTALQHNQELNITLQEIQISKNEIRARKGEYLPFVGLGAGAGFDKAPRYTNIGAMEANTQIEPGKEMPDLVPDYMVAAHASWEVDIWKKLRNAKKSAVKKYLATIEGKNFMVTNLIAEIANSYYELLALDNQLEIVEKNIAIQEDAFEIVQLQKTAAHVTELAVRRFEAQVLNTKSLQYGIQQKIVQTENRINFLLGRFPQHVARSTQDFETLEATNVSAGLPSQLLNNRPDIRQAEQDLAAAKLDVKVAKARFYPSLGIAANVGLQAFNPAYLVKMPESILSTLAGDLAEPLINRNAIKATYYNSNAKQIQTVFNYERTILNAYIEVTNQLSNIKNLDSTFDIKSKQVAALTKAVNISKDLFLAARADYMEVLMTQRDALEAKVELIETKEKQMSAMVNVYRALGGGWK